MSRSTTHPLQPRADSAGMSRRLAILACKRAVGSSLQGRLREDYANHVQDIESRDSYRIWASANRASQDRMWRVLAEQIDADYARIAAVARGLREAQQGSLELLHGEAIPDYQSAHAIHGQPGGYMLERAAGDLAAGVLYEAGGNLYAMGQGIGRRDSKGERLIRFIRESYPDLRPSRILEMGCSAGAQSTDYPLAFPDADCHAIDLSPGMLRFAYARAEALGVAMHFHQMDAGATSFPDGHFDLIVSHNLFHEVAAEHVPAIARECHRLLAAGGVCLHQDVPIQTGNLDDFGRFISEWQKENNDEPFWLDFANADLPGAMVDAGFETSRVSAEYLEAIDGPIPWYVVAASKPAD